MARKGFGFRMEDLQEELAEEAPAEEVVVEETPVELVKVEESEIDKPVPTDVIEEAADEVQEVTESLEAIKEKMIASLATGGMSMEAMGFAQLAIDNACRGWVKVKPMPSMEGVADEAGRVKATEFALEGIAEALKSAWGKIASLAKRWIGTIKRTWHDLTLSASNIEKRIHELNKRAGASQGVPAQPKIKLGKDEYVNIRYDGSEKNVVAGLEALNVVLAEITAESPLGEVMLSVSQGLNEISKLTPEQAFEKFKADAKLYHVDTLIEKFKSLSKIKFADSKSPELKDTDSVKYLVMEGKLIGEKTLILKFETSISGSVTDIDVYTDYVGERLIHDEFEVDALTAQEIVALTGALAQTCENIVRNKLDIAKREQLANEIYHEAYSSYEFIENSKNESYESNERELYSYLLAFITSTFNISSLAMEPDLTLLRQAVVSVNAGYNFALECFENLQEAATEELDEAQVLDEGTPVEGEEVEVVDPDAPGVEAPVALVGEDATE